MRLIFILLFFCFRSHACDFLIKSGFDYNKFEYLKLDEKTLYNEGLYKSEFDNSNESVVLFVNETEQLNPLKKLMTFPLTLEFNTACFTQKSPPYFGQLTFDSFGSDCYYFDVKSGSSSEGGVVFIDSDNDLINEITLERGINQRIKLTSSAPKISHDFTVSIYGLLSGSGGGNRCEGALSASFREKNI